MTPTELLGFAQQLLRGLGDSTSGNASRLAAVVARQAVEVLIEQRCVAVGASCDRATMRSKLAILRALDDPQRADQLASLWHQLSDCCHQHAYELSPTVVEVRALCEGAAAVAHAMARFHQEYARRTVDRRMLGAD